MENMQAENTGGGLWQHEDASLQDVWASHDDTLHAKQVPHPASFKGSNEVQQKVTSGRRRYSSEEMLLLRNKWTHKPAAWNVVREDGKQLACCIDRRGFDWAAGIEVRLQSLSESNYIRCMAWHCSSQRCLQFSAGICHVIVR